MGGNKNDITHTEIHSIVPWLKNGSPSKIPQPNLVFSMVKKNKLENTKFFVLDVGEDKNL